MMKTKNVVRALGIILLLVALGLPQLSGLVQRATAVVDTTPPAIGSDVTSGIYFFWPNFASAQSGVMWSTSASTPAALPKGTSGEFMVAITEVNELTATIRITGSDGSDTGARTLSLQRASTDLVRGFLSWTPSATIGVTYTATVQATDIAGNLNTRVAYAQTANVNGYFTITPSGGSETRIYDKTQTVWLKTRSVTFSFYATESGAVIDSVTVRILDEKGALIQDPIRLDEVQTDAKWSKAYTFPRDGTFTVNGYANVGGNSYQFMSLTFSTGAQVDNMMLAQIGLGFVGALMVVAPSLRKKRRR